MGFENGKLVRVTLRASSGTQEQVNTFHYDLEDGQDTTANDPQSLADAFRDDVRPQIATLFRPSWTLDPVVVVEEKDPLAPLAARGSWNSGAAIAGTGAGSAELLPSFVSPVVALKSDHIGRRFNGRLWLMGNPDEGWQNGGGWTASILAAFATIVNAIPKEPDLGPPLSNATAKWCVYSRTQRAANLDPYASAITSTIIRPVAHSLRRRATY